MQSAFSMKTLLSLSFCCYVSQSFHIGRPTVPTFSTSKLIVQPLSARGARGGRQTVKEKTPPMNEEITAEEVRVVTPNPGGKDEALGIMSRQDAMEKAQELGGLDLIMINENSDPPVCKIVDYSKYRYMQEKKAKELKKNSKATEIKEVKMSYKIDVHDYEVRRKNAAKFILQGNRVKCTVMFRGREVQHDKLGFDLLHKLAADLSETAVKEAKPKREGRNLSLILQPRPEVTKAINEERRAEEKAKKKRKAEAFEKKTQTNVATLQTKENEIDTSRPNGIATEDIDVESSLDDLLGDDDFTDNLFD